MDLIFLITAAGKTYPATSVRTYDDKGQRLALVYKGKLTTLAAADVTSVAFGSPPADPPAEGNK